MYSIVKVPNNYVDYDFIAFSYKGLHSYEDFGIVRVSDGSRYQDNLLPTLKDKTAENPGGDGMYYFGTNYKQKDFTINFAFEKLTDKKIREMKSWLSGQELGDLWFAESPYKVYSAKVTGQPNIKFIPFDDVDQEGNKVRVYKGEGSVTFTAYYPFAHTPDFVQQNDGTLLDGNDHNSYRNFYNYDELKNILPKCTEFAYGDLPFHFVARLDNLSEEISSTIYADKNGFRYEAIANEGIVTEKNGIYEVNEVKKVYG